MSKLNSSVSRGVIITVVLAVVAGAAYFFFSGSSGDKTVKARFVQAVGIYTGTPVKILGVPVGVVTGVSPGPGYVTITMTYDNKYDLAADARAQEVANSLVSDRDILLGPLASAKGSHGVLAANATIPLSRTGGPEELDDVYAALDKLAVALGPSGANAGGKSSGALSTLLRVGAANLKGNGAAIGNSISQLAKAARTLANGRGDLFQTVKNLQQFTSTLKDSDSQVRLFEEQLAQVAGDLASERGDLGAALKQIGLTLDAVNRFVKQNASRFHVDLQGLRDITSVLVRQRASLNETLAVAPVALANLIHSYQPDVGGLGSRSNLASVTDGLSAPALTQAVCNTVKGIGGSAASSLLGGALKGVC